MGGHPGLHVDGGHGVGHHVVQFPGDAQPFLVDLPAGVLLGPVADRGHVGAPVILATIGPRLDWPRLRTERRASRVFSAWARLVYRHRWLAALAGLGILTALMLPALSLHLGEPGSSARPRRRRARHAGHADRGGVPSGVITPAEVLVSSSPGARVGGGFGRTGAQRVRRGGSGHSGLPAGPAPRS